MTKIEYRCSVQKTWNPRPEDVIAVDRILPNSKASKDLAISFRRTIRVPDNDAAYKLPPDLGSFPLHKIQDYKARLPVDMAGKGGLFFPMHQEEAMWINFRAEAPFLIKIYVGGVNAISGEHSEEDAGTHSRRWGVKKQGQRVQDYLVVPDQRWLDGCATRPGMIRQFVAMPMGSGYSVEAQLTGTDAVGGLQFEITPSRVDSVDLPVRSRPLQLPKPVGNFYVFIKTLTGKTITLPCGPYDHVSNIKGGIQINEGIPPDEQRLILGNTGEQLVDCRTLADHKVKCGNTLQLMLRMGGGSPDEDAQELTLAAGGQIEQNIRKDSYSPEKWIKDLTFTIPVHILNSAAFQHVTGALPPPSPINAETYASAGLPFFKLAGEAPSQISGASMYNSYKLKSINEIQQARGLATGPDLVVRPRVVRLDLGTKILSDGEVLHVNDPDGLLNPAGPRREFRSCADLEEELRRLSLSAPGETW